MEDTETDMYREKDTLIIRPVCSKQVCLRVSVVTSKCQHVAGLSKIPPPV